MGCVFLHWVAWGDTQEAVGVEASGGGGDGWPKTRHEEEDFGLALFEFRIVSI